MGSLSREGVMPKEIIGRGIAPFNPTWDLGFEVTWGLDTESVQVASANFARAPYTEASGWRVDISRDNINRLIKVLRRARDQAYGVDE
jgi:hypothetical protein